MVREFTGEGALVTPRDVEEGRGRTWDSQRAFKHLGDVSVDAEALEAGGETNEREWEREEGSSANS